MIDILPIISEMEDKFQNPTTTSKKFKEDLWNFCKSRDLNGFAVEYGTHKGQTTRILSHVFDKVYTFNLPGHFDEAMRLNADRNNIEYVGLDLYNSDVYENNDVRGEISFALIDAVHEYDSVLSDFTRLRQYDRSETCYVCFDDYGLYDEVYNAVNDLVWSDWIEWVANVGHEQGHSFGDDRILKHSEGVICKLLR